MIRSISLAKPYVCIFWKSYNIQTYFIVSDLHHISGYPKKRLIRKLFEKFGIDEDLIVFNADYGVKRAGFLYRRLSMVESIKEWIEFAKTHGVQFKYTKFYGQIHSVWFENKL